METSGFLGPERLTYGPWQALERAVVRLLVHSGWDGVTHIGRSGDKGGDVLGINGADDWVLQVKFTGGRSRTGKKGVDEVRRAVDFYDAGRGAVVSNAAFAPAAVERSKELNASGYSLELWDGAHLLDLYAKLPSKPLSEPLRDYQQEAVYRVLDRLESHESRSLVVMATGLGKTYVASKVIAEALERNPDRRVLWLAHQRELIAQLERASWSHLPKSIATHQWLGGEKPGFDAGVTFATFQSLALMREGGDPPPTYHIVVVDEAHHAMAPTFRRVIEWLSPEFLMGMTATPWRGDELSLEDLFGQTTFQTDIIEGMRRGFLAQIDYRMIVDNIDWRLIAETSKKGYTISDLNSRLFLPERDESIAERIREHWITTGATKGIVFTRSIEHAERFALLLNSFQFSAAALSSRMHLRDRERILRLFRHGKISVLVAVDVLNEGIDVPDVDLVVFLRVTHSRRIFVQQLGRGLRLTRGKSGVRVLDFVSDIRRVAAGFRLNQEDRDYVTSHVGEPEQLRLPPGTVVKFSNDKAHRFFQEYLADVASVEDLHDKSTLEFP